MSRVLRDGIIGISDGLTIPFVLVAGLCGAGVEQNTILIVGLIAIVVGAISMGIAGYSAFRNETEHLSELKNPVILNDAEKKALINLGLDAETQSLMEAEKLKDQEKWRSFEKQFEISELPSNAHNSVQRAFWIATSYLFGGIIPIIPFFFLNDQKNALIFSSILTAIALLCFGFYKARIAGKVAIVGTLRQGLMAFAGAAAAYFIAQLFVRS
jgi:VIT1/CCC1 family predicted Fe2+/Mn2+ transporter